MHQLFIQQPLLAIFFVVALGGIAGSIKIGPLQFGASGALFVGLAVSAVMPDAGGPHLALLQTLGLAFFVYGLGIASGSTFFNNLKSQKQILILSVMILTFLIAILYLLKLFNLPLDSLVGTYAGTLTSSPTLAIASTITNNTQPAVAYAISYPIGVFIGLLGIYWVINRKWSASNDQLPDNQILTSTVLVQQPLTVRDVPGWLSGELRMSYLRRNGKTRVVLPGEELMLNDEVLLVGNIEALKKASAVLGTELASNLTYNRAEVDFHWFLISNKSLAGKEIGELNFTTRFAGVITRVERNGKELLAADSLTLEVGDRVLAVATLPELENIARFFGDSERKLSEIDAAAMGLGLMMGLALGVIPIPLGSAEFFVLGPALGPLIMGIILGHQQRTGPIVWLLPNTVTLIMRQLGLLLFLATVGLSSGASFAKMIVTWDGLQLAIVSVLIATLTCVLFIFGGYLLKLSPQRIAGALSGIIGQPALLEYAKGFSVDERIESGYSTVFAFAVVVKTILVVLILKI